MTTLFAPAKINLFLAVGPPDARGWHPLRTVFQAVTLFDEIELTGTRGLDEVTFDTPGIPEENTVTLALRYAREAGADFAPMRVRVKKEIPTESGLGGGSSDAGAVLAHLRDEGLLADRQAHAIARRIGADVPFFLVGGCAQAEGYGERLTPLDTAPTEWLILARPDVACPTPLMYRRLDTSGKREFLPFPNDPRALHNDFERVMPPACGALLATLKELGAEDAGLTGSGSACFGRFATRAAAEAALPEVGAPWAVVVHTL